MALARPVILVVAHPGDLQAATIREVLSTEGARILELAPSLPPHRERLSWDHTGVRLDDRLVRCHAALIRALPSAAPGEPAFARAPSQRLSWEEWHHESCLERDRSDTVLGALLSLEQDGVSMVNAPSRSLLSRRKPYQLARIRQLGCPVPETLLTNDPAAARSFLREHGSAIAKPAGGGALTIDASDLDGAALEQLAVAPAFLQARVSGRDLRVMVLDGRIISSAAIDVPASTLDFRGDADYQRGRATYSEVTLPGEVRAQCARIAAALGLRFAGLDIKETEDGRFVFLECNNSPIYLDVERKLGHPISARIARALLGRAS